MNEWMGEIKHGHQQEARDGESRRPDKQEQLQTLMPIRWRANVWGTKERKTQTLLCVPRLATRPILLIFRTPVLKCKYGWAELVYLGQVIYTMLSIRERTHGACWLVLKALELAINLVLPTSGAPGQWKPHFIPTTRSPAYAQSCHPWLAFPSLNCGRQQAFFQTGGTSTAFPPTCRTEGLKWVTLSKSPSVTSLCTWEEEPGDKCGPHFWACQYPDDTGDINATSSESCHAVSQQSKWTETYRKDMASNH